MKGVLLGLAFIAIGAASGSAQSNTRMVEISLKVPSASHPAQIRVREGSMATVAMPDAWKFGFVPTVKPADPDTLIIDVLDLRRTPATKVETIETSVRGRPVTTKTDPPIAVHATYIEPR